MPYKDEYHFPYIQGDIALSCFSHFQHLLIKFLTGLSHPTTGTVNSGLQSYENFPFTSATYASFADNAARDGFWPSTQIKSVPCSSEAVVFHGKSCFGKIASLTKLGGGMREEQIQARGLHTLCRLPLLSSKVLTDFHE